ncbi:pentapeptide repeat-containing protein [Thermocoleostomius sinensis]|jgi:uncharacterized protein YjbI with pentapeptide repeats|uniref:Pentapeptide repeat-containing protein n=1 Tax=Thermocoleostomius sinensis A174 TaxID=2016057 RepID=A0A9E8ZD77_9CYAN|nr:pentapeptide repeat-containing protein [Thermocoleostomius sinensis]WAL61134.1 pentapeptide repeat-containing protein [Thermocoleostomius sinensis A174]
MKAAVELTILFAIALTVVGWLAGNTGVSLIGTGIALILSTAVIGRVGLPALRNVLTPSQWRSTAAHLGIVVASSGLFLMSPIGQRAIATFWQLDWQKVSTLGSILGALGQILIAMLAVYVSWQQYVISKDLTIRSNTITQQQTIDAYFDGIAELMLTEDGLLEDFPMERAIAEGRTAAILSSIDASGKAKVLRFLSRSGLITPLKRDQLLGRPILDGRGVYSEDRQAGLRVIHLGVMLAGADLAGTDLRWTDLSDINLIRANLSHCDLVRANLARSILSEACFAGADLHRVRFFYGKSTTATPRTAIHQPNYANGEFTGAVIEGADFTGAKRLSPAQRYYCCAWGGPKTRSTIPGGCEGIPDRLES